MVPSTILGGLLDPPFKLDLSEVTRLSSVETDSPLISDFTLDITSTTSGRGDCNENPNFIIILGLPTQR